MPWPSDIVYPVVEFKQMLDRKTCQEMWVYMPEGRMIRQDDLTQETLAAKATKECDTAM